MGLGMLSARWQSQSSFAKSGFFVGWSTALHRRAREKLENIKTKFDEAKIHAPDETAARARHIYTANQQDIEAMINAAGCDICAFRHGDECRAWPPRARLKDGAAEAVWPKIKLTDWCGAWRAL